MYIIYIYIVIANVKYKEELLNTYKMPPILNNTQITPQALQMLLPKPDIKPISVTYQPLSGLEMPKK